MTWRLPGVSPRGEQEMKLKLTGLLFGWAALAILLLAPNAALGFAEMVRHVEAVEQAELHGPVRLRDANRELPDPGVFVAASPLGCPGELDRLETREDLAQHDPKFEAGEAGAADVVFRHGLYPLGLRSLTSQFRWHR